MCINEMLPQCLASHATDSPQCQDFLKLSKEQETFYKSNIISRYVSWVYPHTPLLFLITFGHQAAKSCSVLSSTLSRSSQTTYPRLSLAPQVWHHPLWLLSPGMSALQLQNLATLAAAAAAAQNSASPSTANPLSSNAASLGALASPGNTAATARGGEGGATPANILCSPPLP